VSWCPSYDPFFNILELQKWSGHFRIVYLEKSHKIIIRGVVDASEFKRNRMQKVAKNLLDCLVFKRVISFLCH
jgi:hypothetical protein